MSRWNPWLTELQPELFVELSPELAAEKGIANLDWVRITSPRAAVRAKALVTRRMRPLQVAGRTRAPGRHALALGLRRRDRPGTSSTS